MIDKRRILDLADQFQLIVFQLFLSLFEVLRETKNESASSSTAEFKIVFAGIQSPFPKSLEQSWDHWLEVVELKSRKLRKVSE